MTRSLRKDVPDVGVDRVSALIPRFFVTAELTRPVVRCLLHIRSFILLHNANMSVQYTAIFHGCKTDNFQMKNCDIFLIFAQNIDCGYTLEPP